DLPNAPRAPTAYGYPIGFADTHLVAYSGGYFGFGQSPYQQDLLVASPTGLFYQWVFVTAVIANGDALAQDQLWIDGANHPLGLVNPTAAPVSFNASTAVSISSNLNSPGGAFDNVAFFNRQLTPAETQAEYASRLSDTMDTTILSQGPVAY